MRYTTLMIAALLSAAEPKPIPTDKALQIARAQLKAAAAQDRLQAIMQDPEVVKRRTALIDAMAELNKLVDAARKDAGADAKCVVDDTQNWDCSALQAPKPEVKK